MRYTSLQLIYFSPTHTSRQVARSIARGTGIADIRETDLTLRTLEKEWLIKDMPVLIAVPVYGGRVAETALERLALVKGENAPVIPVVVYGNRDYEDALLELRDLTMAAGFTPVAAAAFIGEHSYSREDKPIAGGRPDENDLALAAAFGESVRDKLETCRDCRNQPVLQVKGNFPYKTKGAKTPATPVTSAELCIACGTCREVCPTGAFYPGGQFESDPVLCIKCCACVKACPTGARVFDTPYTDMLYTHFRARKEPEIFI